MRRLAATGIVVAAVAGGCGDGSHRVARPPDVGPHGGGTSLVAAAATEGRLAGALLARPDSVRTRGHVQKIDPRALAPRSSERAVGGDASCPDADAQPTPQNLQHMGDVIFCLMNAMRADAGLPPLRLQDLLTSASVEHSQDMVANKYFAHDSQDGRDVVMRLKAVGYIPKVGAWVIGENLVWGAGALATPAALVNAWMNSPPHRANLLAADFKEVGMGVAYGTPADAGPGITVTTDFGTRPAESPAAVPVIASSPSAATQPRRKRALRRCAKRHGRARRRCARAARRLR